MSEIPSEIKIPDNELETFGEMIAEYRKKFIPKASQIVDDVFSENDYRERIVKKKDISAVIAEVREIGWKKFLIEEAKFNVEILRDLHKRVYTPKTVLETLVGNHIANTKKGELESALKELCGEYAGRIYPYVYTLSLSNTNSRRSRAGSTFEAVVYKIYDILGYPFDSQGKVGRKVFEEVGLGKKVDSVLPGIHAFSQRRNKTIIGTMKTSLRERWQEVAEEITRTNIPEIHLLTVDPDISVGKAREMAQHNIVIVAPKEVAEAGEVANMKNIISFEEYFYNEVPKCLDHWKRA